MKLKPSLLARRVTLGHQTSPQAVNRCKHEINAQNQRQKIKLKGVKGILRIHNRGTWMEEIMGF